MRVTTSMMAYIVQNEGRSPEWLSAKTGLPVEAVHAIYHKAHEDGIYVALREAAPQRLPRVIPQVDADVFRKRLHRIAPTDSYHTLNYWSLKTGLQYTYFSKVYSGRVKAPSYEYVARLANALGVAPEWLAGLNQEAKR